MTHVLCPSPHDSETPPELSAKESFFLYKITQLWAFHYRDEKLATTEQRLGLGTKFRPFIDGIAASTFKFNSRFLGGWKPSLPAHFTLLRCMGCMCAQECVPMCVCLCVTTSSVHVCPCIAHYSVNIWCAGTCVNGGGVAPVLCTRLCVCCLLCVPVCAIWVCMCVVSPLGFCYRPPCPCPQGTPAGTPPSNRRASGAKLYPP